MQKKSRRKRSALSFKDVQIGYLVKGLSYVDRIHKSGKVSPAIIRRAYDNLNTTGTKGTTLLGKWIQENLGSLSNTRGRSSPQAGQKRSYRVQEIKMGDPFLRLPLKSMGVRKGEDLVVQFEQDRIVVWSQELKKQAK